MFRVTFGSEHEYPPFSQVHWVCKQNYSYSDIASEYQRELPRIVADHENFHIDVTVDN